MLLDPNLSKTLQISLKKAEFINDNGLFSLNGQTTDIFMKDSEINDFISIGESQIVGCIAINSSKSMQKITRSYQKLGQLFSNLLLVYNIFFLFGSFLLKNGRKINIIDHIAQEKKQKNKFKKRVNFEFSKRMLSRMSHPDISKNIQRNEFTPHLKTKDLKTLYNLRTAFFDKIMQIVCCKSSFFSNLKVWRKKRKMKEKEYVEITSLKSLFQKFII